MTEYLGIGSSDLPVYLDYYEKYLNGGEYVRNKITAAFAQGAYFGIKAVRDGVCAGYFTFMEGLWLTYPHRQAEEEIRAVIKDRRHATVDALMVIPEYRRMGIGHGLCKEVLDCLRMQKIELFLVEIWVYPDGSSPARKIYERMGRSIYKKEIPGFYAGASDYGISCPICGEKCRCGAWLEVIEL